MSFTAEQLLSIIVPIVGGVGAIVVAWGYSIRRRADASILAMQTENEKAKADAQARIKELEADAQMRDMLRDLIKLNDQLQKTQGLQFKRYMLALKKQRENTGEGYRVIRNVQNDTNVVLANVANSLKDLATEQKTSRTEILTAVKSIPSGATPETLNMFAQQLGSEMGMVLAQQLQMHQLERDLFPFPDAEDPRWETVKVVPVNPATATIWKQPQFRDEAVLKKPCAQIKPDGETVKIIRGQIRNWWIIYKVGTDSDCWGWIPEGKVRVLEEEPAT